jgi:type II secretory pathway pseudopilin PulG
MTENPYAGPVAENNTPKPKRWMSFTLWELLTVVAIMAMLMALLLPFRRTAGTARRRMECHMKLKQIGNALNAYIDRYGNLPPAYTVDTNGNHLHSWRTLILPYLDQEDLYNAIDLSKPWDDPANAGAIEAMPAVYRCPAAELPTNFTSYLGSVGVEACFHSTRPRAVSEFTDGRSETLMVIEMPPEQAVHWMSPQDASQEAMLKIIGHDALAHADGFQGVFADGSVSYFSNVITADILQALTTIAGDDQVGDF